MKKEKIKKAYSVTVPANKKGRHIMPLLNVLRVIVVPFLWLAFPFRFYGNRKIKDGACVYICNHYRLSDVMYPAVTTWEGIHFVAKKSLAKSKFLNFFCRRVKVLYVNRDGNDARGLIDGLKCLKNGEKISLFPEGTRNKTSDELQPFKSGASIFAIKARVPVVPIMIYKRPKPFRLNHVLIGEPFELSEFYEKKLDAEIVEQADQRLIDVMQRLRDDHTEFLRLKKKRG